MKSPCEMVFVYGTLRCGGSNHFRMAGAEFVAAATVRGRLYQIEWYPGLVLDESAGEVLGEVYQVSGFLLERLDDFEGGEYRRVLTQAQCGGGHRSLLSAWIWEWLGPCDEKNRIISGDWLAPPRRVH
jgi:gamma-glutamylaminecyclotransferase